MSWLQRAGHDGTLFLKESFKLPPKAARTILATWDHFAIAAHETGPFVHELQQVADCVGAIK